MLSPSRVATLLGCAALLAACGPAGPGAPSAAVQEAAARLRPAQAALAEKYERSCMVCHSQAAAQAPLTGDAFAWQPRLAQGMDTLVRRAQQGIGSMPAGGQCADCTADDLRALIHFMAEAR